jgi:tetratricopeptide (TPR) repeat protein
MNKIIKSFLIVLLLGVGVLSMPQDGRSQAKDPKVRRALQQLDLGAPKKAIDELKKIIAESPKNAEAHAALALAYLDNKQVDLAATSAQAAFDIDRKVVLARIARAAVYGRQGNHKDALKEFEQAIKLDDKDVTPQLAKGRFYLEVDSVKRAEQTLLLAQSINDKDVRSYLVLGEVYEKQRIKDLAISQFEEAKKLDPNDVSVRARLAALYFRNRQYTESINEWIGLARIDSTFSQAFYQIGRLYFLAEQYPNAIPVLQKYTVMEPDDINGFWLLAQALTENNQFQQALPALEKVAQDDSLKAMSELLLAKSYVYSKEYPKALEIYKRGKNLAAGDYDVYARALVMSKDTAAAIDMFKKSLVNDTDRSEKARTDGRRTLATLLIGQKRFSEAADVFIEIATKSPTVDNWGTMGYIYGQAGDEAKALEMYDKALAIDPNHVKTLLAIGNLYAKDPTSPKMKEAFERAAKAAQATGNKDGEGQAEGWIGYHIYSLKNYAEAIPHFLKAETLLDAKSPYLTNFLLMLGASYHYQKDYKNAEKYYKMVLERQPDNKSAKDALENVRKLQGK